MKSIFRKNMLSVILIILIAFAGCIGGKEAVKESGHPPLSSEKESIPQDMLHEENVNVEENVTIIEENDEATEITTNLTETTEEIDIDLTIFE